MTFGAIALLSVAVLLSSVGQAEFSHAAKPFGHSLHRTASDLQRSGRVGNRPPLIQIQNDPVSQREPRILGLSRPLPKSAIATTPQTDNNTFHGNSLSANFLFAKRSMWGIPIFLTPPNFRQDHPAAKSQKAI
jgi:hypothetical protein